LVRIGVVPRPGGLSALPDGWEGYEIPMDPVDLSSSFIREVLPTTENLRKLIPEAVIPIYESSQG
jgi:nicotinic acid mononucleotide adenylyltransferase